MSKIGENIKELALSQDLNQKQLAEAIGIDATLLSDTINHNNMLTIEHLIKVCQYFNVSLDYVLGRTDTYSPFGKHSPMPFSEIYKKIKTSFNTNKNRIFIATGIRPANIDRWIKNINKPSTESLIKLADHFGCSVDFLVGIER